MNRSELNQAVRARLNLSHAESAAAVDAVLTEIGAALTAGREVRLHDFGAFTLHTRGARQGKGLNGQPYQSEPKTMVHFRAAKALAEALPAPKYDGKDLERAGL